jgi:hypothetical protein
MSDTASTDDTTTDTPDADDATGGGPDAPPAPITGTGMGQLPPSAPPVEASDAEPEPEPESQTVTVTVPTLAQGAAGTHVRLLHALLGVHGAYANQPAPPDGQTESEYSGWTERIVRAFQAHNAVGLKTVPDAPDPNTGAVTSHTEPTGVVDVGTWRLLLLGA